MNDETQPDGPDGGDGATQQSERTVEAVRDRAREASAKDEDPGRQLGALDDALEAGSYPVTTDELVEAHGDLVVETSVGTRSLESVLAGTDNQTFDSADDVRSRILGLVHR